MPASAGAGHAHAMPACARGYQPERPLGRTGAVQRARDWALCACIGLLSTVMSKCEGGQRERDIMRRGSRDTCDYFFGAGTRARAREDPKWQCDRIAASSARRCDCQAIARINILRRA